MGINILPIAAPTMSARHNHYNLGSYTPRCDLSWSPCTHSYENTGNYYCKYLRSHNTATDPHKQHSYTHNQYSYTHTHTCAFTFFRLHVNIYAYTHTHTRKIHAGQHTVPEECCRRSHRSRCRTLPPAVYRSPEITAY